MNEARLTRKEKRAATDKRRQELATRLADIIHEKYEARWLDLMIAEENKSTEFNALPDSTKDAIIAKKINWPVLVADTMAKFRAGFRPQEMAMANEAIKVWTKEFDKFVSKMQAKKERVGNEQPNRSSAQPVPS